jgi:hypothetical protein
MSGLAQDGWFFSGISGSSSRKKGKAPLEPFLDHQSLRLIKAAR